MDVESKKQELLGMARQLGPVLQQGLTTLLQEPQAILEGLEAGLGSLRALQEITRLVYCGNSPEQKQRKDFVRHLCGNLTRFCQVPDLPTRVAVLMEIQCPLEVLHQELRGAGGHEGPGCSQGTGCLVWRLSADLGLLLQRADTFARMAEELSELSSVKYLVQRQARLDRIAEFCERYGAHAALLDFQDSSALEDSACRGQLLEWLQVESRDLLSLGRRVHETIDAGTWRGRATADWRADLDPTRLRPVLAELLRPALEMVAGLCTLYERALQAAGGDPSLYRRFTELGLAIDEIERCCEPTATPAPPATDQPSTGP